MGQYHTWSGKHKFTQSIMFHYCLELKVKNLVSFFIPKKLVILQRKIIFRTGKKFFYNWLKNISVGRFQSS